MDYYVMQAISIEGQDTAAAVNIVSDEREARMLFHQVLASAYANDKLVNAVVEITNAYGGRVDIENWHAADSEV